MNKNRLLQWGIFVLLLVVVVAATLYLFPDLLGKQKSLPTTGASTPTVNPIPVRKNPTASSQIDIRPTNTAASVTTGPVENTLSTYPPVDWIAPPPCQNQPEGLQALSKAFLAPNRPAALNLRRAQLIAPALAAFNQDELNTLMTNAETPDARRQALLGLAVNIADGRLNRATGISFDGLPDIKTAGDLLDQLEAGLPGQPLSPALLQAGQHLINGQGILKPVCAHLLVTQNGLRPMDIQWADSGIMASAANTSSGATGLQNNPPGPLIDTVTASPDGRWAAFTSIGNDAGGPVLLMNLKTGEWSNLLEKMNANRPAERPALMTDGWWDLVGWMPDSQHLAIGPSDASALYLVDIDSGAYEVLPFNGGGNGGAMFIGLSSDGSQMAYVELSEAGDGQILSVYRLADKQSSRLVELPYSDGVLLYPRFSPDGRWLAYVIRTGAPDTGYRYAINLYDLQQQVAPRTLVEGNLGLSVPAWSPDGQYLAFTRKTLDEPDRYKPDQPTGQVERNIWVAAADSGQLTQVTFVNGLARRPMWAADSRTLSFITHDGQVGLVNVNQPGQVWQAASAVSAGLAAGSNPAFNPLLTSAFFVP